MPWEWPKKEQKDKKKKEIRKKLSSLEFSFLALEMHLVEKDGSIK